MWRLAGRAVPAGGPVNMAERAALLSGTLAWIQAQSAFFDRTRPLWVARAPGRLDVMGGFGDYSGARVLEFPIAQATWVAAQESEQPALVVRSAHAEEIGDESTVTIPLAALFPATGPLEFAAARALLTAHPKRAWAAYVAGVFVVLHHACGRSLRQGLKILVRSEVPLGKGVSSSAALEMATLEVAAAVLGDSVDERRAALLAQQVENLIVGAPCGVMDQITSVSGQRDAFTEILCQPAELCGHVPLPPNLELWAIDSGIRHAVSGASYSTVRAAAFMGYRIVAETAGLYARIAGGRAHVDDPVFGGYLANVSPADWRTRFCDGVPERLDGASFLARYGGTTDDVTHVDPGRTYAVRACAAHPILENERVGRFRDIILSAGATGTAGALDEPSCVLLGALMAQAHASYSACGLGSDGTDHVTALVGEAGPARGLYGAKITGGGSGGTVVVLARRGSARAIEDVVARYQRESGRVSHALTGSSMGARAFGVELVEPV